MVTSWLVDLIRFDTAEKDRTYQEERVCRLEQTSKGVVPSSKRSKDTKDTTSSVECDICATSSGREVVSERQHQESEIQREEEEEESNRGLERAHEHDEGEDELEGMVLVFVTVLWGKRITYPSEKVK